MTSRAIRVGLLGFGTVGSGVYRLLEKNREIIERRIGTRLEIARVAVKHLGKRRAIALPGRLATTRVRDIFDDPSIDIVVELIGGEEPAYRYLLEAMQSGKHIVTANKAVLAKHWVTLMNTAKRRGVDLYLEASVGGGIPLIQALHDGLAPNHIQSLYGIVNGTTNYILTQMSEHGASYPDALARAQAKGFAEADPTFDVEGIDSAHKLAILTAIAFNRPVTLKDIYIEGISQLSGQAILEARQYMKHVVKLLAIARRVGPALEVRVHPTLIPEDHLLAAVKSNYNAVSITGDAVGPVLFYGQGAGPMPTASAVLSDIIFIARNVYQGVAGRVPSVQQADHPAAMRILPIEELRSRYYLRFNVLDRPGMFAKLAAALSRHQISIASVMQLVDRQAGQSVPVALTTHEAKEGSVRRALKDIQRMKTVAARPLLLRIEKAE